MQLIAIKSDLKSTYIYSKWAFLFMAVFLFAFSVRYLIKGLDGGWELFYGLSAMTLAGGILMVISFFRGPMLSVDVDTSASKPLSGIASIPFSGQLLMVYHSKEEK